MKQLGLFVGLTTVDLQYLVERFPKSNTKIESLRFTVQPGGPAFNAATTFSYLGGSARLVTVVGKGHFRNVVESDAKIWGVEIHDAASEICNALPISAILTEETNGNRTIVNSPRIQPNLDDLEEFDGDSLTAGVGVILVDGFYIELAFEALKSIQVTETLTVLDAGRWRPGIERILPKVTTAICGEHFAPPGVSSLDQVVEYLHSFGIPNVAITCGERPIIYSDERGHGTLPVPAVPVVDTLGAGDIFHGAYCYFLLSEKSFTEALQKAAEVASRSCCSFGTREWMR